MLPVPNAIRAHDRCRQHPMLPAPNATSARYEILELVGVPGKLDYLPSVLLGENGCPRGHSKQRPCSMMYAARRS